MTINTTSRKAGPFTGTGLQTAFPFSFKVFQAADLRVVITSAAGVETDQVISEQYTVALSVDQDSGPGGTVTMLVAPPAGSKLTIASVVPVTQGQSIPNNSGFYPKIIENALDKLTIGLQQVAEQVSRTLRFAISDSNSGALPTAAQRAEKLLGFDSSGNLVTVSPAAQSAAALAISLLTSIGASMIGFIQSGASAVAMTVQDALRDRISPKQFGGVGDGVTDDTAALQAAINEAYARGGGAVNLAGGRWLVDSATLMVKSGVTLQGPWKRAGEINSRNYLDFKGAITLNPAYTINLAEDFAAIDGVVVVRKGITVPTSIAAAAIHVAAFAGTAITVGDGTSNKANDTFAGHCLIIGFAYAYYNDYSERADVQYLSGDCTNGIYLNRVYDMDHLVGCHFWPYTTTHQAWTFSGDAGWRRQGTAYYMGLGVDWGQAVDCFSYGYDKGFDINGSDNVVLLNCGADGYKDNNAYAIGYHARGTTKNLNLVGCKSASKFNSVLVDLTGGGTSQCIKITGGNLWAASAVAGGTHVYVKNGSAIVTGGVSLFDGPTGVKSDSSAGVITITNVIFQLLSTPYALANVDNAIICNNAYNSATDAGTGRRNVSDNQSSGSFDVTYGASGLSYYARRARGTAAAPSIILANDAPAAFNYQGWDGSTWRTLSQFRSQVQGAPSAGVMPGMLIFSTNNGAGLADRLAIHNNGDLYPLTDNANACGINGNRWSAVWAATGTIQTSDARTKTDIEPAVLGLDFINALQPVSYRWIEGHKKVVRQVYLDKQGDEIGEGETVPEDATAGRIVTESVAGVRTHWGFLAQQVKGVIDDTGVDFAGWVLVDKDDPDSQQALRYDQFIAPLVKAVQQLSAEVERLKARP